MKQFLSAAFFILILQSFSIAQSVERICPPNWWVGMNNKNVQLMIHGDQIAAFDIVINYPGVEIYKTTRVENPNYIFLDLIIKNETNPGTIDLIFKNGKKQFIQKYELKAREKRNFAYGYSPNDFIYLLMPDRFSNGDPSNDIITGMLEDTMNRSNLGGRHGGDLQGIINHLDYIKNLGATATWCTPLIENDQKAWSYHGYASTDQYKIDPRYGTSDLYKKYVEESHKRNLKVVVDLVHNHVGSECWFVKDLPMKDFIHQWDSSFVRSNYRTSVKLDPYASAFDYKKMNEGWFDKHMPDLNQDNAFTANYLIQNNIWWIENYQVDGFRLDTYPYSDLNFLIQWKKAIDAEYPGFGIFGEVWVSGVGVQAYFQGDNHLNTGYNSLLPGLTDFNLYDALITGLNEDFGWYNGVTRLYHNLAQDYMYGDVMKNVLFVSNHDVSRFYSVVGEDMNKFKMGIAFIMTTRGMVQWYYGDEILMKNLTNPDGRVREDFPGGWANDSINKFNSANLNPQESEIFNYVSKLANWRKNSEVIRSGKLMQFIPEEGVYVYFRYTENKCVMVVMNSSAKDYTLDSNRFAERLNGYTSAKNVVTDKTENDLSKIVVKEMGAEVFELGR